MGKEKYDQLLQEIENLNVEDTLPTISSTKLDERLTQLSSKLEEIKSSKFFQDRISKQENYSIKNLRKDVISCLKENAEKPLNCWEEVQKFKEAVNSL